ncbi:START domain-containing protein [Mucilaginibacter litoreus]|uniref:START domain-containing protein n=1 Tax=Mucilaginibacter litoreus TaxID=1048221 RepID=A0ABW3AMT5_9SPHI
MLRNTLSLLLILLSLHSTFAQNQWALKSNTDGIKIYTATVADSKFKALKVECDYDASLSQIVAVLLDVNTCTEWVYHTKSVKLLKQPSPAEVYYYSEVSLPWPASNRDFIAHLTAHQDAETKIVTVDGPAVNGLMPPKNGIVRVTESTGKWIITPVTKNQVKVVYTLHVNPAGSLPAWLVNMFASEGPTQSFKGLRAQLKKPKYANATLPFIVNY